jgi:hypothetical protein
MDRLYDVAQRVPELKLVADTLQQQDGRPDQAENLYRSYLDLIGRMARLTDDELTIIRVANDILEAEDPDAPSRVTPNTFIAAWDRGSTNLWNQIVRASTDVKQDNPGDVLADSPAMVNLEQKLLRGHELKRSGKQFSDDDAESRAAIWQHLEIYEAETLMNFTFANYLQEFVADYVGDLQVEGKLIDLSETRDFLIQALSDVLIIDHIKNGNEFNQLYAIWARPRSSRGIGWVTDRQLRAYTLAQSDHTT